MRHYLEHMGSLVIVFGAGTDIDRQHNLPPTMQNIPEQMSHLQAEHKQVSGTTVRETASEGLCNACTRSALQRELWRSQDCSDACACI